MKIQSFYRYLVVSDAGINGHRERTLYRFIVLTAEVRTGTRRGLDEKDLEQ